MNQAAVRNAVIFGAIGFLLCLTIVLMPIGLLLLFIAFILFIYGLVARSPEPVQVITTPALQPVAFCPQCRNPVSVDANYCLRCGADTRIRTKEIIKEKEVIIKMRCPYCGRPYDETENTCPYCGGKH